MEKIDLDFTLGKEIKAEFIDNSPRAPINLTWGKLTYPLSYDTGKRIFEELKKVLAQIKTHNKACDTIKLKRDRIRLGITPSKIKVDHFSS